MKNRICFVVIISLLTVAAPALGKGKPAKEVKVPEPTGREAREREARKACLEGDYVKGNAGRLSIRRAFSREIAHLDLHGAWIPAGGAALG